MKHFLIEVQYTAPIERIEELTPDHRAFLQKWYEQGILLMSGPQEPRTGGIIIGRAESRDTMENLLSTDPFHIASAATYKITEFKPVRQQTFMADWCDGK